MIKAKWVKNLGKNIPWFRGEIVSPVIIKENK